MEQEPDTKSKIFGLRNTGNTCFLNASLQFLLSSDGIREALCNANHKEGEPYFSEYFRNAERNRSILTDFFVKYYTYRSRINRGVEAYSHGDQADAGEFLNIIFDILDESFEDIEFTKYLYDVDTEANRYSERKGKNKIIQLSMSEDFHSS